MISRVMALSISAEFWPGCNSTPWTSIGEGLIFLIFIFSLLVAGKSSPHHHRSKYKQLFFGPRLPLFRPGLELFALFGHTLFFLLRHFELELFPAAQIRI